MPTARKVKLGKGELTRLSQITGASLTHLHFVLRGERKPSHRLAEQIAAHLGQPVSTLFPELAEAETADEWEAGCDDPAPAVGEG